MLESYRISAKNFFKWGLALSAFSLFGSYDVALAQEENNYDYSQYGTPVEPVPTDSGYNSSFEESPLPVEPPAQEYTPPEYTEPTE